MLVRSGRYGQPVEETLFVELKRYVGWNDGDELALRALSPLLQPRFPEIINVFYDRILEHPPARAALVGGESQVGHLKIQLARWLEALFTGPWDEAYYQQRARIGRMHVRISLPQHYMFAAMNVLRRGLDSALAEQTQLTALEQTHARTALGRILDLELAIMLHTFREDLLAQQARGERLATFGQMAASIGHELRNPLGVIETSVYLLRGRVQDNEPAARQVERIGEQVGIASGIITGLLQLIRDKPLTRERIEPLALVEAALALVSRAPGTEIRMENFAGLPPLHGDLAQLRQVFVNLIENAVHAGANAQAPIAITAALEGEKLAIAVEDGGPGVDAAIRSRLFEPLITSKENGTGLGLSLAQRIVQRHQGTLTYEPRSRGARFVVRLPLVS